ncbi:DUF2695 domain-containing protein [Cryobacterium serini]|uniref:DUF2695 domain-containing protein n=1 Tax=Cryobacterium serini TaxID=1259201 RepID=A0A4R9BSW6_9MICO|nr:DUF2695 domain-containing protein [Cryobacterium serini]
MARRHDRSAWTRVVNDEMFLTVGTWSNSDVGGSWQGFHMERISITERAERILHDAASTLMTPTAGECLVCFVARQVDEFGCDGTHRFASQYRDSVAPRATELLARLSAMGACCCDCEMFMNTYEPATRLWSQANESVASDDFDEWADPKPPDNMSPCETTRRGSTKPCANWERTSRSRYR